MARIQWNPLQGVVANAGLMDAATQGLVGGIGTIGGALKGFGQQTRTDNTNAALAQILGINTLDDLATQRTGIAQAVADQGRGLDQVKVLEALGAQQDALTRRAGAGINLEASQLGLQQTQQGIADQPIRNEALQQLLAGNVAGAQTAMGQLQGDASPLFSAIRGEQRYDDQQARQQMLDKRSEDQWQQSFGLQKRSSDRADLATGMSMTNFLNPQAGQTEAQAVYNPESGDWEYTQSSNPSRTEAFSSVMSNLFNVESRGVHRQRDGSLTRSPAGALGIAQIMPTTAAKPGYGMKPIDLQNTSPQEQQEWATDYITRIGKAHKFSVPQAVAAYNAGAGRVQEAISKSKAKGGTGNFMDYLPKETKDYVPKVLGNNWSSMSNTSMASFTAGTGAGVQAPKAITKGVNTIAAATGIPLNAKHIAAAKQSYASEVKKLTGGASVPESPLASKDTLDGWLLKNRTDKNNTNTATRVLGMTDADDLYKTANKNAAFTKLPTSKKIKVLDHLMTYNKNNQGLFWKNPNDLSARIDQVILEDVNVTKQVQDAKRLQLLDASASKILAAAGVQPGAIPPQALYSLLDPEWSKKGAKPKIKGLGEVNNPFQ